MKKNKTAVLIILIVGIIVLSVPKTKKEENKEAIDKENILAIKLKNGSTYTDTDTVPTSGYTLNTTESICKDSNGNKITTEFTYTSGKVMISITKKGTKCSLVFNRELSAVEYLMSKSDIIEEYHKGYRYEGKSPNNYVTFNNETWRIIGVFRVQNTATSEYEDLVKIIRNDSIGNIAYNTDNNDYLYSFEQSEIREILNNQYYNGENINYSYKNSIYGTISITGKSLNETSRNMVQEVNWDNGGGSNYGDVDTFYSSEVSTGASPYSSKVGLMYISDYGYAADSINCPRTTTLDNYSNCKNNNWLFSGYNEWSSSNYFYRGMNNEYYIKSDGSISDSVTTSMFGVRPVVYLKSNVKILDNGKDGSSSKPYDLAIS